MKTNKDKVYNVYVYGAGKEYDEFVAHACGYGSLFHILAIVTTQKQPYICVDGIKIIRPEEMDLEELDYVIIAVEKWKEIFEILLKRGIAPERILHSSVFKLPYFDFEKYVALKKAKVSILCNSCIGGRVYKKMALEALSPIKNMYCLGDEFVKFCNNIEYYISKELRPYVKDDISSGTIGLEDFWQKGKLDDITWTFNHNVYAQDAINRWNRYIKRVNLGNIAVIMIISNDEELKLFRTIKYEKKLGIYFKKTDDKKVVYCPVWLEDEEIRFKYMSNWYWYANEYLENTAKIDWLKFLGGEKDYYRAYME